MVVVLRAGVAAALVTLVADLAADLTGVVLAADLAGAALVAGFLVGAALATDFAGAALGVRVVVALEGASWPRSSWRRGLRQLAAGQPAGRRCVPQRPQPDRGEHAHIGIGILRFRERVGAFGRPFGRPGRSLAT
jgi:hypothetical protein